MIMVIYRASVASLTMLNHNKMTAEHYIEKHNKITAVHYNIIN